MAELLDLLAVRPFMNAPTGSALTGHPETDAAVRKQRARQAVAQSLLLQSMKPRQGQMVGRFYVPPSPLQTVGDLSMGLMGYLGTEQAQAQELEALKSLRDQEQAEIKSSGEFLQGLRNTQVPVETPKAAPQAAPGTLPYEKPPVTENESGTVVLPEVPVKPQTRNMTPAELLAYPELQKLLFKLETSTLPGVRQYGQDLRKQLEQEQATASKTLQAERAYGLDKSQLGQLGTPFVMNVNGEEKLVAADQTGQVHILGSPGRGKSVEPKEYQSKANQYAMMMEDAEKDLAAVEGQYSPRAIEYMRRLGGTWGIGGPAADFMNTFVLDKNDQRAVQAMRNFVTAVLRPQSGATITKDEMDSAIRQYFPEAGDTPEVIEQKARNRATAWSGLRQEAGPAYQERPDNIYTGRSGRKQDNPNPTWTPEKQKRLDELQEKQKRGR